MSTGINRKGPDGHTEMAQTGGSKQIKVLNTAPMLRAADIHKAPPSRIYTRDYAKVVPDADKDDLVSPALGDPLRW